MREITMQELKENSGGDGSKMWVLIAGMVYDLTDFDHPGGCEILQQNDLNDYKDNANDFEDAGHSPAARKMMKKYIIGTLKNE